MSRLMLVLFVSAPAIAQPQRDHAITIDDYATLATIRELAVSPDGKQVAYTEARWDKADDLSKTNLWVVATDASLTSGVVTRVELARVASLAPLASLSGSEASIVLPEGIAPGTYFVGVRVSSNSELGIPESSYLNNQVATAIQVGAPSPPIIP